LLESRIDRSNRVDNRKSRTYSTLTIVLMSTRVAKENDEPIAKVFGNVALQALNRLSGGNLILSCDISPLFWIQVRSDSRRLNEVAKKDRQVTTLSVNGPSARLMVGWRRSFLQRHATVAAEFLLRFIRCAAARTFRR
jgi:hypothetical protein